ncbi:protein containing Beta-ketoacyl synthase, partial [Candidatus Thiomargarita nelsonii]
WEDTAAKFPPQMAELSRALGYHTITATQGLHSFLAGLYHQKNPILIGLEGNNHHIRALIETETYSLQKLTAYFSANTLIDSEKWFDFSVNDRFQTPSHCDLVQLHEPVQFDPNAMELWPSVAEYFVYDELLYYALTHDERRNQSYKIAMNQLVKNKIVVEVGTGKEAILSRFCVEAGAKKVYAIEIGDDAYQEAVACVNNLGLSDKIILIHGDSTQVEIPELADVCVSEIVGPIGGCEGAALLMNDARRFLKPKGVMLPARGVTKMVAITFPNELWTDLGFNPVPGSYTEKIFAQIGYPFDLRVCIKKFPQSNILSNADIFEDLDFNHPIELEHSHTINLTINQEAQLNGFLVWLNLHTVEGEVIDILEYEYSWLPVYLPIFHPGIQVSAGDTIQATCERRLCENGLNPDYHLKGRVIKQTGEVIEFEHNSYHHKQVFKQSAFFQKLFVQNEFGYNQKTRLDKLTQHLPQMPLTENGTIDREKLVAFGQRDSRKAATQVVPQNKLERQIAQIWQEVLGIPTVGIHDNFFELGGHSLLLVQAQNQLQALFGSQLSLVDLFNAPTIDALAKHLSQQSDTEPKSSQQGQARAQIRTHHQAAVDNSDIAIVGMSCRFPGANTLDEFWHNLRDGIESITFFSDDDVAASGIDPTSANAPHYVKASPLLDNVEWFDASFFGYTAKEAELLDPQQRLFLECAWEAMEIAGYDPQSYQGSIGLYAGASMNTYLLNQVYPNRSRLDSNDNLEVATLDSLGGFQLMVANDKDYLPTRTSYKLNLKGPSINVQTACSTTLVTVHLACQSLLSGECDMVLSGGSSVQIPQKAGHLFQEGMIVSPDGHCRAFDARAQGTVFGSGVGVVVLKRLTDAIADDDHIYAVIKGSAVNNDGLMKVGYMAPSSEGQAAVASEALAMSGVATETIQYVEAHGTGTEMGDPIEVSGLTQATVIQRERQLISTESEIA